jgi:hypothetical protein
MVATRQQLATASTKHYSGVNRRHSVTIHETANLTPGANAAMHANLQSRGNVRNASWHWQVDDKEAVQSFLHTTQCWHAGDGEGPGNLDSVAIEICVNPDSDFVQAVHNAADLTRQILATEGLHVNDVVQHNRWTGKNCPTFLRSGAHGITWDEFLALVGTEPVSNPVQPAPTPAPKPTGPVVVAPGVPAPPFPLPRGWYFGPKSGPEESVSGFYSHREDLRRWQQRMKDRGWAINPDGLYGSETAGVAHAFQVEKHLDMDSLIGPETWAAAWTAPITR